MNTIINNQLNRRSIRSFKNQPIDNEIIEVIIEAARHSATSSFGQSATLISVTDKEKKQQIADICNQKYVADSGHLFIIVLDHYRNHRIATEENVDTEVLASTDRFLAAAMDCGLMAQNIETAAMSFGLGAVFLGSIQNNSRKVIELLDLPEYTFPLLGVAIGYADVQPQIKPKLPKNLMHFENTYQRFDNYHEALNEYDTIISEYYDTRDTNRRVEAFTTQMTKRMDIKHPNRMKNLEVLNEQGILKY